MIGRLVVFGATGDLTGRYLLPSLAQLSATGRLPEGFTMVGAAQRDWDDDGFRRHATEQLEDHAAEVPRQVRESLVERLAYRSVDVTDPDAAAAVLREDDRPVAAYLALPTGLMPHAVEAFGRAEPAPGSRVALEKPFGEDLEGARELNALLARVLGDGWEQAAFRVDHALGMSTVQGLLGLRFGNRVLDALWNAGHIEEIEVLWEETLALEGRASFYDRSGALRDVVQNHVMQVLCMVGMERPDHAEELESRKADFLRAVRDLSPDDVVARTRRARYAEGRLADTGGADGEMVPDYIDEEGVDPGRDTETFAEVVLQVDVPRWAGTRFRLRAGKALAAQRKGIVVRFRPVPGEDAPGDELWIGVDGPNDLRLRLVADSSGTPLTLAGPQPEQELSPYAQVLLDLLEGRSELSVGSEEAEQAWRILTPVLDAWKACRVPMEEYAAGSTGP